MKTFGLAALALTGLAGTALAGGDLTIGMPTATAHYAFGEQSTFGTRVVDPNAAYSNVTNFQGAGVRNTGTALVSGINTTKLVADDLNFSSSEIGKKVMAFRWSTANFNTAAVSARMRIRFYTDSGSNSPGTYITGLTFNPIALGVGVTTWTYSVGTPIFTLTTNKIWAAITFDASGTTTTAAQLDNLGQGLFNPPDVGTSADLAFRTSAAGSFVVNNPAGAGFSLGDPLDPTIAPANFGWEIVVPTPGSVALLGLGGLVAARRRRA